jgi:two-component system, cell cycle sensor histidine kinase and response regulator CckA
MKRQKDRPEEILRKRAEDVLAEKGKPAPKAQNGDMERTLQELQVHQIELEMQNEELIRAQAAIEESRSRFAELYDFAPVGYFTFDGNGLIKEVNLAGAEMLGVGRKQLIDRPFSLFVDPDIRDAFSTHYRQALQTGRKLHGELILKYKEGAAVWVAIESVLSRSSDGMAETVRSVLVDVTAQKQTESKLREANAKLKKVVMEQKRTADALARFEATIEQVHETLLITDRNWNIEYANRSASTLTGYEREELIGMNAWTLRDSGGGSVNPGGPLPSISECGVCSGQYAIRKKDGTTVRVEGDSTTMWSKDGSEHTCVVVLRDITERARLERELRQSQKMEALGTFAAGIAHDFNNILAGIMGFTEMVLEDTDPADPRYARLSLVVKGANRGRDLARQILAYGRSVDSDLRLLSLGGAIWEAQKLLRATIPSTVEITVNIKTETDRVSGDPTLIQQVLVNLGSNAAYAMKEKGGVLEITLADAGKKLKNWEQLQAIKPGAWLNLTVRDTGFGMTPEVVERIFDPFFTTKGPGEGTGMGLSVVHGIMKDHGGQIVVESEPGKGSAFHLFFPSLAAGASGETKKEPAIEQAGASILFVDDEEMLVEMNRTRLGRLGHKVTATTSSPDALKMFKDNPGCFDLLITDYTMPHMTGIDLAKKIQRIRKGFPVILCTGVGEEPVVKAAKAAGIGGFLSKPFGAREISSMIGKVLPSRKTG